jgi:nicotinate phosphoribosyltransferase
MSFPSELESFKAYADIYPRNATFLIDTYNTLESGLPNAITAGKDLAKMGFSFNVRLDSGDIDYLSRNVRQKLDEAGFPSAKIVVSNELDEAIIEHLVASKAPIDVWGVGTNLVTGGNESAFTGVYKLAAIQGGAASSSALMKPVMKFSDNPEKSTNPGTKRLFRLYNDCENPRLDIMTLEDEMPKAGEPIIVHHPSGDYRQLSIVPTKVEELLNRVMENGKACGPQPSLSHTRDYFISRVGSFDGTYLRQLNPHIYKVSISGKLKDMKLSLIKKYLRKR